MLILLLILSPIALACAICFVALWHKAHRTSRSLFLHENTLCHIGISVGVEYPTDYEVLNSVLDCRYPLYEVVVVIDLQDTALDDITHRHHLVRVNFSSVNGCLDEVRGLYRSHHRPSQQVVVLDIPKKHTLNPYDAIRYVASYPYLMRIGSRALLLSDSITYIANTIASYPLHDTLQLRTIVGTEVRVEHTEPSEHPRLILIDRILGFDKGYNLALVVALIAPIIPVAISLITGEVLALIPSIVIIVTEFLLIYISWHVVVKKNLFVMFGVIATNFYRFLVGDMRSFCYLYKESEGVVARNEFCTPVTTKRKSTYDYDRTNKKLSSSSRLQCRHSRRRRDYEGLRK